MNGRDLSLLGGAGYADGLLGHAINFQNDTNQSAYRPVDDDVFDFQTTDFTLQVWVNFTAIANAQSLIGKYSNADGQGWMLTKLGNDAIRFQFDATSTFDSVPLTIAPKTWHQLIMRRSGSIFEVLMDGNVVVAEAIGPAGSTNVAAPLLIGRSESPQQSPLNGRLDEVAIWSRALSNPEITALYNQGTGAAIHTTPQLSLDPTQSCVNGKQQLTVAVNLANAPQRIVRGAFHVSYDVSRLTLHAAEPGDAAASDPLNPFESERFEFVDFETGDIDYVVGLPIPADGTMGATSGTMAVFTFDVIADVCNGPSALVLFRAGKPPTQIEDENSVIYQDAGLTLSNPGEIRIDTAAPIIEGLMVSGGGMEENCVYPITYTATITDNCCIEAENVSVATTLLTENAVVSHSKPVITAVSPSEILVSGTLDVSALRGCPATIQVTVSSTDCCGNIATPAVATTDILDKTPPIIVCDADASLTCAGAVPAPDINSVNATDSCSDVIVSFQGDSNLGGGGCAGNPQIIQRVYRATDACGNFAEDTQTFTIIDTEPPVAVCRNITLPLNAAGNATLTPAQINHGSSDNCSNVALSVNRTTFTCADRGPNLVTLTVTDACGNAAQCDATVTVVDNLIPDAVCPFPAPRVFLDENGIGTLDAATVGAASTDNCGIALYLLDDGHGKTEPVLSFDCGNLGAPNAITLLVQDTSGNFDLCGIGVPVIDNLPPTIMCPPDVVVAADAGGCDVVAANLILGTPVTEDNCNITTVTNNAPAVFPLGQTTVTWTARDRLGNTAMCEQIVTVLPVNELSVDVALAGDFSNSDPFTRCLTFDVFSCADPEWQSVTVEATFIHGAADGLIVPVPCGDYACVRVRDANHTLMRTDEDDFEVIGRRFVANFTAQDVGDDDSLIGGNFNNDAFIDILDFGIFVCRFGVQYDNDLDGAADGDLRCGAQITRSGGALDSYHPDPNGDGTIDNHDFGFFQESFLAKSDDVCCGLPGDTAHPITAISVLQLQLNGLRDLAPADLNQDGWLDQQDIAAYLDGARPRKRRDNGTDPVPDPADRPEATTNPRGK
ncbi:MAG: LamG-like jellyroll fold domain-containing protein [Phycisphaerae bacterium]